MTRIIKKLRINAPQKKVWEVISDLGGIQDYNPMVKKSFYNTDIKASDGAGRVCEFHPMGKVEEKAVQWNGGTMVETDFTYETTSGLMAKIMNMVALKRNFEKGFEGVLMGLKIHIEEGKIIENNASLKGYKVSFAKI